MKNQQEDRRVQRTKQLIESALIELTVKKGYDKVSVQDIVDFANVGRATFYAHYEDKDDLFTQSIERFFNMISNEITLKIQIRLSCCRYWRSLITWKACTYSQGFWRFASTPQEISSSLRYPDQAATGDPGTR